VLHGLRAAARADLVQRRLALFALEARRAHFDQLVRGKRAVDLGDHRVAQSLAADQYYGLEPVSARLERLALGR